MAPFAPSNRCAPAPRPIRPRLFRTFTESKCRYCQVQHHAPPKTRCAAYAG
jgi:hypothetical protein